MPVGPEWGVPDCPGLSVWGELGCWAAWLAGEGGARGGMGDPKSGAVRALGAKIRGEAAHKP